MHMGWIPAAALLLISVARADDSRSRGLSKRLIGNWQMTKGVVGGNPFPDEAVRKMRLELTGGKYKLIGAESPDQGDWTLHSDTKPDGLDIKGTDGPNKGRTILAIFELRGDSLKVCYDLSGKNRPTKFEAPKKTLLFLAEYQRVKPASRGEIEWHD